MATNISSELGDSSFDYLIYLRLTEACNLYCSHCFIPSNPKSISFIGLEESIKQLKFKIPSMSKVMFQFHGGEPTLKGIDFLSMVIQKIKKILHGLDIVFTIQTNLMTYNKKWGDFYKKELSSSVGISWDYSIRHVRKGKELSNEKYENTFWDNVCHLIDEGNTPWLVITLTKKLINKFKNSEKLLEFLHGKGIRYCHIEKLTKTGYAYDNWEEIGVSHAEYSYFMSDLFYAYKRFKTKNDFHMSPFDGLSVSTNESRVGYGCWSGKCDTRFYTVDANGLKAGCTALTSENKLFISDGQQEYIRLVDEETIASSRKARKEVADCKSCEFNKICNTGCMANQTIDHSGECSGNFIFLKTIQSYGECL